ncbi:MAG: hypothetical protein ACYTGG_04190 [Planctomycetota bacterium]|jgi:hypothetical protein
MQDVESIEAVPDDFWDDATPLCSACLHAFDPLQHYCDNCGTAVGQFTSYIPFVNIPFSYSFFERLWLRLWLPMGDSIARRTSFVIVLLVLTLTVDWVWILPLLGTPLWWRYDTRRLIRGAHERHPECETPADPTEGPRSTPPPA